MANTLLIKRSGTANAVPSSGNLELGELAINYTDGNLFYKNASNVVTLIASNKTANFSGNVTAAYFIGNGSQLTGISATGCVVVSSNSPGSPKIGDIWIDSDDGTEYLYFNDGTSNVWAEMASVYSFSTGGGATVAGANTQIQFNSEGVLAASANLTFDGANVTVGGNVTANSFVGNTVSVTGNVTGNYFIGNGSQLTGIETSAYSGQYVLTANTTNASETQAFVNGVANSRITVSANTTMYYTVDITCRRTDAPGDHAAWFLKGVATNNAGNTSDVGSLYEVIVARTDAALAVDIRADNATDSVGVFVTGATGKTISWRAVVTTVEV